MGCVHIILKFLVPPTSCGQAHLACCNILLPCQDLFFWKVRDNRGLRPLDSSSVSLGLCQIEGLSHVYIVKQRSLSLP